MPLKLDNTDSGRFFILGFCKIKEIDEKVDDLFYKVKK